MGDAVQEVEPDALADEVTGARDPLSGRGDEHRGVRSGLVDRSGGDGLDGRLVRLQDRERRDRDGRELGLAGEHGWDRQGPVGDDHDLRVDPLLPEESSILRVHHLRGGFDRDDRDLDLRQRRVLARGRGRCAGRRCDGERDEGAETRGARERPLRLPASSPCGHRPADTGDRNAFCDEINAWISFRVSRNRAELRVSVCERGRGRPTSTDPMTRPGCGAEDEHAVGEVDGLVDVVRHMDDSCGTALAARVDLEQHVLELGPGEGVDRRERLVQQ